MADTRFNVWIIEAKMRDGIWYPMPKWGAGELRRDALEECLEYAIKNNMVWAMNKDRTKPSRHIRARKYIPIVSPN